jgi:UDP-glucose 4-epimerase
LISVGDSTKDPLGFFENNFVGTLKILKIMKKFNCKFFIFSSTAAIFGQPDQIPIQENDSKEPINPYGETKLAVEKMLKWCDQCLGIKYVSLRYFNACGADEKGDIGEAHHPESHLIPIILQVAMGQRKKISIFGDDYETKDGTVKEEILFISKVY